MVNTSLAKPRPDLYQRVPCVCRVRTADIYSGDQIIGTISEEQNDAGETDWVIKVDWEAYDKQEWTIAGIDVYNRREEYIRRFVPSIVSQRTMPDNRFNLKEELDRVGLTWNDRFEFMCRTHGYCGPSRLTIERQPEEKGGSRWQPIESNVNSVGTKSSS